MFVFFFLITSSFFDSQRFETPSCLGARFVLIDSQRQCMQWSVMINKGHTKNPRYIQLLQTITKPNIYQTNCTTNYLNLSVLLIFPILFLQLIVFFSSEAPLPHLCSCVSFYSSFVFLSSWNQSGSFTFLLFLISSLFPDDPLFFPSSFPLPSVRKGNPARVFVWWWDRLCRFSLIFHSLSLFVSPVPALPPPCFICLFWSIFEQWCLRRRLWPFTSCPIFCSSSIRASPSAYKRHQNLFNSDNTHTRTHTHLLPVILFWCLTHLPMDRIRHFGLLTNIPEHHRSDEGHSYHCKHQYKIIPPFF